MDNDELKSIAIERYLDGLMTEAESTAFEQQMQADPTLQAALEDERLVRAAMQRQREQDLRAKLKKWRQEVPETPAITETPTQKRLGMWLLMLVMVLVLLGGAYQHFFTSEPPEVPVVVIDTTLHAIQIESVADSGQTISPSKGSPIKANDALRKRLASVQTLINLDNGYAKPLYKNYRGGGERDTLSSTIAKKEALDAMDRQDFDRALRRLKQANQDDAEVLQLTAHALFGSKRYSEAAESFRALIDNKRFSIDARWNMVMSYFAQYPDGQEAYQREIEQMLQNDSPPSLRKKAKKWKEMVRVTFPDDY
jgi:tetratricopeptide (TPR) repeat protein